MHISSFVNNPDDVSRHSNEYAAGTVGSQSFAARRAVERNRNIVGAYNRSHLGVSSVDRAALRRSSPTPASPEALGVTSSSSRQEMNSRTSLQRPAQRPSTHTFREPPSRGYNPYA